MRSLRQVAIIARCRGVLATDILADRRLSDLAARWSEATLSRRNRVAPAGWPGGLKTELWAMLGLGLVRSQVDAGLVLASL